MHRINQKQKKGQFIILTVRPKKYGLKSLKKQNEKWHLDHQNNEQIKTSFRKELVFFRKKKGICTVRICLLAQIIKRDLHNDISNF